MIYKSNSSKSLFFNIALINSNLIFSGISISQYFVDQTETAPTSALGNFIKLPIEIIQKEILEKYLQAQDIAKFNQSSKGLKKLSDETLNRLKLGLELIHYLDYHTTDLVKAKEIIKSGKANIDVQELTISSIGYTALMSACRGNHIEIAKLLIESGANLNTQNNFNETALLICARLNRKEIIELLLTRYNDFNKTDHRPKTALMWAVDNYKIDIVELLIYKKANINQQNKNGNTALHNACYIWHKEIVELLIHNGADPHTKNRNGKTALDIAKQEYEEGPGISLLEALTKNRTEDKIKEDLLEIIDLLQNTADKNDKKRKIVDEENLEIESKLGKLNLHKKAKKED